MLSEIPYVVECLRVRIVFYLFRKNITIVSYLNIIFASGNY